MIEYAPHFWTPNKLSNKELNEICGRLMRYQSAAVMAMSVMDKHIPEPETPLSIARNDIQKLIRHIGAITPEES